MDISAQGCDPMKLPKFILYPLKWITITLCCVFIYLIVIVFLPGFTVPSETVPVNGVYASKESGPPERQDIEFQVHDNKVKGWLYQPQTRDSRIPCIVMNNGLGGTRDMLLEPYALRFCDAGYAVITYDYRHFGDSEGEPRQLYNIEKQINDCRGAIAFARNHPAINPSKIAVWGTSAGGSYGLYIAATDGHVAAVCAQVAGFDHSEAGKVIAQREGLGFILKLLMHAQRDKGRSRFNLSEHTVPIVGRPGSLAMSAAPGAFEGYSAIISPSFRNQLCARAVLNSHWYDPVNFLDKVHCPVLIQAATHDNHCPVESAREAAKIIGQETQYIEYDTDHYSIYLSDEFDRAVNDQITFFRNHL